MKVLICRTEALERVEVYERVEVFGRVETVERVEVLEGGGSYLQAVVESPVLEALAGLQ